MQDIPVFTTDTGVSSLLLEEIPYKQVAFVRIQDVQPGGLREHLEECARFCRMAGAERVLASGNADLSQYPVHSIIYRMSMALPHREPDAALWPATEETIARWRELYNQAMAGFDNHATLSSRAEAWILQSGGAYFVHRDGALLGLGLVQGDELSAVVSLQPGMGQTVTETLCSVMNGDRVTLEVVDSNTRAIRLYERMGFVKTGEARHWYRI